ncbi:MAG: hypothetical protein KatS3mg077_1421 [Candidatus Binatia bacterium]|nr:MAG: hypothetical protein KatS3mg077_1421 [Candidatus Binatia bacterium]
MRVLWDLPRTLLLSYRLDGLGPTVRRAWRRLFGKEEHFILIRYLDPPVHPVELPATVNGIVVRQMSEADIESVARLAPFDLNRSPIEVRCARLRECLPEAFVALRDGRIVGASWYADRAKADQPWFGVLADKLIEPSRLTAGIFSVPGERAAAWVLSRQATAWLSAHGIRTVVGFIRVENQPSLVLSRMLGGRIVARQSVRYCLGVGRVHVEPAHDTDPLGRKSPPRPVTRNRPEVQAKTSIMPTSPHSSSLAAPHSTEGANVPVMEIPRS